MGLINPALTSEVGVNIRVLVFDFDGLIMDTETPDYASWQEIFVAHDAHLPMDVWSRAVGTPSGTFSPSHYLEELIERPLNHREISATRTDRFHEMMMDVDLLPGVLPLIEDAKAAGWHVCVASSADRPWVRGHLERKGMLELFDVIRTAEDVVSLKPAPDLYLAVLNALGVPGTQAIALEDSPTGMHAVKAAGLYGVAVPNSITQHYDLSHADAVVPTLEGMTSAKLVELIWSSVA